MAQRWVDGQIDDALLATASAAGFLYARRRIRRVRRRLARGAVIGAAAATVAGVGAVGVAGGALARYRKRRAGTTDQGFG
jgi:hypothetical protein